MARKIYDITERRYLKKSSVECLVRRLLGSMEPHPVHGDVFRRYSLATKGLSAVQVEPPSTTYIPAKLPPAEIGGCHFQEPQSETWKRAHRNMIPRLVMIPQPDRAY